MLSVRCAASCPEPWRIQQGILRGLPGTDVMNVTPLATVYAAPLALPRAALAIALLFAVLALIASVVGQFSVISRAVSRRSREFGVRMALGASPAAIQGTILRHGLGLASAGLGVGLVLSWLGARLLSPLLFGVRPQDPLSLCAVTGVLLVASIAAAWRPSRRAMGPGPLALLRE
jgi:putative ABC transport system permease protein